MWLVDTNNLQLKQFQQCPARSYAILSHTWAEEELDFDEFKAGEGREKAGFEKIRLCCEQAKHDGLEYAWIDTVCIDKRSSTELSEAINIMFTWYQQAEICYVYLVDVSHDDALDPLTPGNHQEVLRRSRWFTRGWTLQELVAPESLTFYSREWIKIGDKADLAEHLHLVTRIDINVLTGRKSFRECSVAQRMSWACTRDTTRIEDMAYCLVGLFNINLPLMYGEGAAAFIRLQQRIIELTDDETIFAWTGVTYSGSGLLAPSAKHFENSTDIQSKAGLMNYTRPSYTNTNKGIFIECQMLPCEMNTYVVPLSCCETSAEGRANQLVIFVGRTTINDQYRRVPHQAKDLDAIDEWRVSNFKLRRIFIPTDGYGHDLEPNGRLPVLHINSAFQVDHIDRDLRPFNEDLDMPFREESKYWRPGTTSSWNPVVFSMAHHLPLSSVGGTKIQFQRKDLEQGVVLALKSARYSSSHHCCYLQFGFDFDFKPICILSACNFQLGSGKAKKMGTFWSSVRHIGRARKSFYVVRSFWADFTEYNCWRIVLRSLLCVGLRDFEASGSMPSQKVKEPFKSTVARGSRSEAFTLDLVRVKLLFNNCTFLQASLRPLPGLEWEVNIGERRRHHGSWTASNFCARCFCLSVWYYFRYSAMLHILLTPAFIVITGFVFSVPISYSIGNSDRFDWPSIALSAVIMVLSTVPHLIFWGFGQLKRPDIMQEDREGRDAFYRRYFLPENGQQM